MGKKIVEPVVVLLDGPLQCFVAENSESTIQILDKGVPEALQLLNSGNDESLEVKSMKAVRESSSFSNQLACLRSYRSSTLNLRNLAKEQNKDRDIDRDNRIGMYRFLLEVAFSENTQISMKRACESCLSALVPIIVSKKEDHLVCDEINEAVVRSLLDPVKGSAMYWANPLQTLFDLLSFEPTLSIIMNCEVLIIAILNLLLSQGCTIEGILKDHYHSDYNKQKQEDSDKEESSNAVGVIHVNVLQVIEKGVEICAILKLFLSVKNQGKFISSYSTDLEFKEKSSFIVVQVLRCIVVPLLRCKATSSDSLVICSMALSQLLLLRWTLDADNIHENAGNLISLLEKNTNGSKMDAIVCELSGNLPQLNKVAIMKGLVATLPDNILSQASEIENEKEFLLEQITSFTLNAARICTENGARLLALKSLETVLGRWKIIMQNHVVVMSEHVRTLSNEVLILVLSTWESPPSRQIASAIPGVFNGLVKVMEALDQRDSIAEEKKSIDILVNQILSQPSSQKGRYIALETLLPKVGAKKMIQISELKDDGISISLVTSLIREVGRGGNSSGSSAELLAKMLSMLRVEMHKDAGIDLHRKQENKKERRRKERLLQSESTSADNGEEKEEILLLIDWYKFWVPPLANALLNSDATFRNHISSYCLPLLVTVVGGKGNRIDAAHMFALLLDELCLQDRHISEAKHGTLIWAKLEVIRHAHVLKLLKLHGSSKILNGSVCRSLPVGLLRTTLFHEEARLRCCAFQTLEPILIANDDGGGDAFRSLQLEVALWKEALPYAMKCSDKEYVVTLIQTLRSFLGRISNVEANCGGTLLFSFVSEFLLEGLFVKHAAYPGTVADKEKWALAMIECVMSFALQHKSSFMLGQKRKSSKHSNARKISKSQQLVYDQILYTVLGNNVLSTLFSLLASIWDFTRSSVYQIILQILDHAVEEDLQLPGFLSGKSMELLQARAIHLASSPRQREADTGARILCAICATMNSAELRFNYLKMLSDLLLKRIIMMESSLGLDVENDANMFVEKSIELPLAHGLIQSIRLIVEKWNLANVFSGKALYEDLMMACFRAIEVSLIVVADIKDVDEKESVRDEDTWKLGKKATNVPLNVNTGAIGANVYASIGPVDDDEQRMRLIKQRIIMGTWLLIKEACPALSSIMASFEVNNVEHLTTSGNLLIGTLVSLKHQGAAFAAHKALQRLCSICYHDLSLSKGSEIRLLPSRWSENLLLQITSIETVRDSTLRRSTGYGLGFLSILRSERVSPRFLFPHVLSQILKISLPPSSVMKEQMYRWGMSAYDMFVFSKTANCSSPEYFIADDVYEERSRVHALNILRLIILDAPLATEMREFVGDSIIVSLIGYKSSSWAIRNSATMCFAAAMLRVVDADKNADMSFGQKNAKRTTNAVTCRELFRSYPPLAVVLLSLIKEENTNNDTPTESLHPTLFPVFLLLARLQPLSLQRTQTGDNSISQLFIDPIVQCLGHVHHKVRLVAARALAVLCSDDNERVQILDKCIDKLSSSATKGRAHKCHNIDHGILLAIKYLLGSSMNPTQFAQEKVMGALLHFSSWCDFKFTCPPSCTAVALDAWQVAAPTYTTRTIESPLFDTAFKLIQAVEHVSSKEVDEPMIGLSTLAKASSQCICKIAFFCIFDGAASPEEILRYVQIVEHCFTSKNYDIMLYSVKTFKKEIYDAVEKIIADDEGVASITIVSNLAIRCISHILSRDKLNAHPPTLRRLSRIALECIHAFNSLRVTKDTIPNEVIDFSVDEQWEIYRKLLCIGGYDMKEIERQKKTENLSGGNALAGNALELLGFLVRQNRTTRLVKIFIDLICQSMHPLSSWKIRHSAAISIEESGLVTSPTPHTEVLSMELFQLFQDSDDDVRKAAGRAMFAARILPTVSLKNLELAASKLSEISTVTMFNRILRNFVGICANVENRLSTITIEYKSTANLPETESILNLNTERKIFEEEEPNPFLEVLVMMHASIASLCRFPVQVAIMSEVAESIFSDLYKTSSMLLKEMKYLSNNGIDLAHNLTFDAHIFPYFHGSIIGTALGFWFGKKDEAIIDDAIDLMGMQSLMIHPCITHALRLLICTKSECDESKQLILQNCFLIPSQIKI